MVCNAEQKTYDIESIKDYCYCPLYYHYKHETPAGVKTDSDNLHYTCIRRVFYFIMYSAQGGSYPNKHEVKNAYNRLIKSTFKHLSAVRKKLDPGALKRGLEQCVAMQEQLKQYGGQPVLINCKYTIDLKHGAVTGVIDTVVKRGRQLELVMLQQDKNKQQRKLVSADLSVIAASAACRKLLNKPLNAVGVYYIEQGRFESINIGSKDLKVTEVVVDSVIDSIGRRVYYPAAGRDCDRCTYYFLCAQMKWLLAN